MNIPVINMSGEEVRMMELPSSIFEARINRDLMHQALVRQLANARQGTHKAQNRAEVSYTTAKTYRQKGTGNARHGSRRAPIFVGGGVAHGPKVRKYTKSMPRKMRRAALRSALSVKAADGEIVVLDKIAMETPKTKTAVSMMNTLAADASALVLLAEHNENVEKAFRNVSDVTTLRASYLNIRDLLGHDKLIMPLAALETLESFLTVKGNGWEAVDESGEEE
jgi:large subunit ribosomal protein L4